jgi:excisionase family DNA binding protein
MLSDTMIQRIEALPCIMSINDVAKFFLVSRLTIYRMIRSNDLPAYKDEYRKWCISRQDLKQFASKNCNL